MSKARRRRKLLATAKYLHRCDELSRGRTALPETRWANPDRSANVSFGRRYARVSKRSRVQVRFRRIWLRPW